MLSTCQSRKLEVALLPVRYFVPVRLQSHLASNGLHKAATRYWNWKDMALLWWAHLWGRTQSWLLRTIVMSPWGHTVASYLFFCINQEVASLLAFILVPFIALLALGNPQKSTVNAGVSQRLGTFSASEEAACYLEKSSTCWYCASGHTYLYAFIHGVVHI